MIVYTHKHELIRLADAPFSSGGEGEVRSVESAPARFTNVCAKIYYQHPLAELIQSIFNSSNGLIIDKIHIL